jgi:hypothetical protein
MNNQEIRLAVRQAKIKLWRVADALGITDSTLSRKLRHELPEDEKQRILAIIRNLSNAQ